MKELPKNLSIDKLREMLVDQISNSSKYQNIFQMLYLMNAKQKAQLPFEVQMELTRLSDALPAEWLTLSQKNSAAKEKQLLSEIKSQTIKIQKHV